MVADRGVSRRALVVGGLLVLFALLFLTALGLGASGGLGSFEVLELLLTPAGGADPLARGIAELRLERALATSLVGAALALSGALLQGVFRNPLAAPSILGIGAGASLGASLAILAIGGFEIGLLPSGLEAGSTLLVGGAAFVGGLAAVTVVGLLSATGGRFSIPMLLLTGIAVNACLGGLLAVVHGLALDDHDMAQALLAWGFGNLEDRGPAELGLLAVLLGGGLLVLPFTARELDLLASGEEDASALGVPVRRVQLLAIVSATLLASGAVAVAGQIGFVGLVAPHVLRLVLGSGHRLLLPASLLAGAILLLGTECVRTGPLADSGLRPGALTALLGGPFFLGLLVVGRRSLPRW